MFAALIARSDIDFIALDKGDLSLRKAVDMLMQSMEEYANYGFHFIKEKGEDIPNYFYKEDAFLGSHFARNNRQKRTQWHED